MHSCPERCVFTKMDLTTLTAHPFHRLTASEPLLFYVNHKQRDGPVNDSNVKDGKLLKTTSCTAVLYPLLHLHLIDRKKINI